MKYGAGQTADSDTKGELRARLEEFLLQRISMGRFVVPAAPELATRCLEIVGGAEAGLRNTSQIIERDPGLAAQVLRLANDPSDQRPPVRSIDQALMRVGAARLRKLLVEARAEWLVDDQDPRVARLLRGVWEHSRAVALLSRELCPLTDHESRDAAYLAGLLHDLGKPVIIAVLVDAAEHYGRAVRADVRADQWLPLVFRCSRQVGRLVSHRWVLPHETVTCIDTITEYDRETPRCVENVVRLAHALACREGFDMGLLGEQTSDYESENPRAVVESGCALLQIAPATIGWLTATLRERLAGLDELA